MKSRIFRDSSEIDPGLIQTSSSIPALRPTNLRPPLPPLLTLPPIPPENPPVPPLPAECPQGFSFKPGFIRNSQSLIFDWRQTTIGMCADECKKDSSCRAIEWGAKTTHCRLLRTSSVGSGQYQDYIHCAGKPKYMILVSVAFYDRNFKVFSIVSF